MGVAIPIIMIVAACAASTAAVIVAVSTLATIAIILAVVSVAATAASIYFYTQADIKNSMLFAGIGIAAGVGGVYAGYVSQAAEAAALLSEGTAQSVAAAGEIYAGTTMQIVGYAQSVYSTFQGFLEAIHFKTLLTIHKVAYLLSADYREQVDKIYGQIRQVSEALGYGADFMQLILRDTRNLVMDVSSSIGKPYDVCEITWMNTFGNFMQTFAKKAESYRNNPSAFLWDLDDMVMRPGVDAKAYTVQTMIAATERAVEGVKLLAEDVTRVRTDVIRFVADLPLVLREKIEPAIKKVTDDLDDFMRLTYDPTMKVIDKSFKIIGDEIGTLKQDSRITTARLLRPGTYLKEIDRLSPAEKAEQEKIIAEIASRQNIEDLEYLEIAASWHAKKLTEEALTEPPVSPPPKILTLETATPAAPGSPEPDKTASPFVGDY